MTMTAMTAQTMQGVGQRECDIYLHRDLLLGPGGGGISRFSMLSGRLIVGNSGHLHDGALPSHSRQSCPTHQQVKKKNNPKKQPVLCLCVCEPTSKNLQYQNPYLQKPLKAIRLVRSLEEREGGLWLAPALLPCKNTNLTQKPALHKFQISLMDH